MKILLPRSTIQNIFGEKHYIEIYILFRSKTFQITILIGNRNAKVEFHKLKKSKIIRKIAIPIEILIHSKIKLSMRKYPVIVGRGVGKQFLSLLLSKSAKVRQVTALLNVS